MRHGISTCALMCIALGLSACHRSDDFNQKLPTTVESLHIPLIQAKAVPVPLPQDEICEQVGCTQYDFQSIHTNLSWIDEYFLERLHKMEPIAFEKYEGPDLDRESISIMGLSKNQAHVRYVGQNGHLATFILHTYTYSSGAEHGIYHDEYINFDLNEQRRIGLQDILITGKERALAEALYNHNQSWLQSRNITAELLPLSDNFYYSPQGLVLVYALYELGTYTDGMTELVLPYDRLNKLIQAEYLPALPEYPKPETTVKAGE
jgi:hypothetical protein